MFHSNKKMKLYKVFVPLIAYRAENLDLPANGGIRTYLLVNHLTKL